MSLENILRRTQMRKAMGLAKGALGTQNGISSPRREEVKGPCVYRGEKTVRVHGSVRDWRHCNHPQRIELNIPDLVCTCTRREHVGCGTSCKGYTAKTLPEEDEGINHATNLHLLPSLTPHAPPDDMVKLKWVYGVTTVPSRRDDLLPRTLLSLRTAGFDKPRLFVDGCDDTRSWMNEFDLEVTARNPPVKAYGNWVLALAELYIREPGADRFAIFQDDMVTYRNLRQYLEACPFESGTYLNLYTFPPRTSRFKNLQAVPPPRREGDRSGHWFASNQNGRGALALVFDRKGVQTILSGQPVDFLVRKANAADKSHRNIDGGVVEALKKAGYREMVHDPSLVQHIGFRSAIGNKSFPQSESFRGEAFDAMELLTGK